MGRPARLPAPAAPGRRERRGVPARGGQARDHGQGRAGRDRQRPVREPPALHLPRLLPAGLQGQRQGVAADHPHPRRAGARRGGAPRRDGDPDRRGLPHRPRARGALRRQRPGAIPAGPDGGGGRVLDRDAPATAELGVRPVPRGPVQRLRPGGPLPHGAGRAADRGPLRRRGADVQGAAARSEHRGVLRDRPGQGLQARVLDPDRLAPADHLGRARRGAGALGFRAARVHERLRALVLPRGAVRVPPAAGEPGDAGRREGLLRPAGGPFLLFPVRQRPGPGPCRAVGDGGHPARRRGGRGHHHPALRPPGRRGPDGRGRTARGGRPARPELRRPQPLHHRRQRASHPGQRQPGPDDHDRRRADRRSPDRLRGRGIS